MKETLLKNHFVTFKTYTSQNIFVSLEERHFELPPFEKTPFYWGMLGKNSCLEIYFVIARKQNKNKKNYLQLDKDLLSPIF